MNSGSKEVIDYATAKLDVTLDKLINGGNQLTQELVNYQVFKLHIDFVISSTIFIVGCVSLYVVYKKWETISQLFDETLPLFVIIPAIFTIAGALTLLINGYNILLANSNPLMWAILKLI